MKLIVASTILGLFSTCTVAATAAEATSEDRYIVPARYQISINWFEENRPKFYRAANAEILKVRGKGEYLVRSQTPVGPSTYVVKETEDKKDGQTKYRIKLVKQVSGRVEDMQSTVTITRDGSQTQVTMTTYIDFRHLLASTGAVKRVTDRSVSQTKELLVNHVPR